MLNFITRRLLSAFLTLLVLVTLLFFVLRTLPGGPFDVERNLAPVVKANLEAKYSLDKPLWVQYLGYLGNVLQGDLGPSYTNPGRSVQEIIAAKLQPSAELGLWSLLLAIIVGLPLGVLAAYYHNTVIDYGASFLAIVGRSIPNMALGPLLIVLFGLTLQWLPVARWETWDARILPVLTLGLSSSAVIARLTRASMLQIIREPFVLTARAKGLSEIKVIFKHALRNALIPALSIIGPIFAVLITGTLVVEQIFAIPGLGSEFVKSINNRDYPLIMGITLLFGFVLIVANTLVDMGYALIDPRIRLG
jgi:oligopeptide transport system permease protein